MTLRAHIFCIVLLLAPQSVFAKLGDGTTEAVTSGSIVQMIVGLTIVLGILIGGAMLVRRLGNFPAVVDSPLKVITSMSLSPRDRLVVVQVGDKQLLLGLSPGRIQNLHVLEQPLDMSNTATSGLNALTQRFSALLHSQMKK